MERDLHVQDDMATLRNALEEQRADNQTLRSNLRMTEPELQAVNPSQAAREKVSASSLALSTTVHPDRGLCPSLLSSAYVLLSSV